MIYEVTHVLDTQLFPTTTTSKPVHPLKSAAGYRLWGSAHGRGFGNIALPNLARATSRVNQRATFRRTDRTDRGVHAGTLGGGGGVHAILAVRVGKCGGGCVGARFTGVGQAPQQASRDG